MIHLDQAGRSPQSVRDNIKRITAWSAVRVARDLTYQSHAGEQSIQNPMLPADTVAEATRPSPGLQLRREDA
jgi:hypothetical protein